MLEILNRICDGKGEDGDIERLENLAQNIKATALCGLGQTAPNPVLSTIKQFRHEYEAHIYDKHCPAGVCKKLLNYVIDPEKCRGCTLCARVCPRAPAPARSRSRIRSIPRSASSAAPVWRSASLAPSPRSEQGGCHR